MNIKNIGVVLLLVGSQAWAQVGELSNADITEKTSVDNPAKLMSSIDGEWIAFSIPAVEGTRSPCCWTGRWNGMGEVGCDLASKNHSYGNRSDAPVDENVIVFSRIRNGGVDEMRVVGESCPVNAGGAAVTWLGEVDEGKTLNWLEQVARSEDKQPALHALSVYRGTAPAKRLYQLAKERGSEISEDAVFWLGEARGEQGFEMLKRLMKELPHGDTRRKINFALAVNQTDVAADLLFSIAESDPDKQQRTDAMFWLSQEYPVPAEKWLTQIIETETDETVLEQAVFAISQLPDDSGDRILLSLAADPRVASGVRRQAIFWLANSDSDSSIAALTELLTQ